MGAAVLSAVLLASGVAHAGESAQASAASGIKVGIDRATGKLRQLTDEESAALDATATSAARATTTTGLRSMAASDAVAGTPQAHSLRVGGSAMKVPLSEMSHLTATVDASGKVVVRHGADGDVLENATAQPAEVLK